MSGHSRSRSAAADRTAGGSAGRIQLKRVGIEQRTLSDKEAQALSLTISGWQVIPSTPAGGAPIAARAGLAAGLNARGRYCAPRPSAIQLISTTVRGPGIR